MTKKILVINPFGIGDVLFSTPLLKALKKKFPDSAITYICNRRTQGLLKNNPSISIIYEFEKDEYRSLWEESKVKCLKKIYSFVKKVAAERYDILVDMSLGYLYSLMLAIFASIPIRIGFNYRKRGRFLTHKLNISAFNSKHVIEYYLELGKTLGLDRGDKKMYVSASAEDKTWARKFFEDNSVAKGQKICGIIPGCGASWGKDASYRRWSSWKFAEVADHVIKQHKYKIIIFGDAKEAPLCEKVGSEMKEKAIQACGKTTLGQFTALLDMCDMVITNDGGPLHIAIALQKKTIAIFGPVDERIYGPYPVSERYITVTSPDPCRPCYRNFKYTKCEKLDCLKNIPPERVIKEFEVLAGRAA